MKKLTVILVGIFALCGSAIAHDPTDGPVALEPESLRASAGKIVYEFQLVENKTEKLLSDKELNVVHERKLHMMVYDPALKEFHHVHPEFNGRLWTVELNLNVNGKYWVWAQGELTATKNEFSAVNRLDIGGGHDAWPTPPVLKDTRSGSDGNSKATLSSERLKAGKMAMITVTLARNDGTAPEVTPYLGAFAHAIAVPDDGDALLHVHPMDGSKPTEGMLHMTFPRAGLYRIWIQFMDGGREKTVPLSVKVF